MRILWLLPLALICASCMAREPHVVFKGQKFTFWMRNTRIPLDIMYFDADLRLINVQTARPCRTRNCPTYPSTGPAKYVLELNAGKAAELGAQPGDRLELFLGRG